MSNTENVCSFSTDEAIASAESVDYVGDFLTMQEYKEKMEGFLIKTECIRSQFCEETGLELYLKKDFRQVTGSCHARSALCTLLSLSTEQKQCGVITAVEEDALPLCYFAEKLDINIIIVLPNTTLLSKIKALEEYSTTTMFIEGNNSDEAETIASEFATNQNIYCIKRGDRERYIGYGSIGIEILEQVPNLDVIVVPDYEPIFTSIITVMKVRKPSVKVIIAATNIMDSKYCSVEPTSFSASVVPSMANVTVLKLKEHDLDISIVELLKKERCLVDRFGVMCLAACTRAPLFQEYKNKNVVSLLTSTTDNIADLPIYLERGLVEEQYLVNLIPKVSQNRPNLIDLENLREHRLSIKRIMYEQELMEFKNMKIDSVCEYRGLE